MNKRLTRTELLALLVDRFGYFISQDRYISMEEALNYILAQLEREKVLTLTKEGQSEAL